MWRNLSFVRSFLQKNELLNRWGFADRDSPTQLSRTRPLLASRKARGLSSAALPPKRPALLSRREGVCGRRLLALELRLTCESGGAFGALAVIRDGAPWGPGLLPVGSPAPDAGLEGHWPKRRPRRSVSCSLLLARRVRGRSPGWLGHLRPPRVGCGAARCAAGGGWRAHPHNRDAPLIVGVGESRRAAFS